ncbi:C40 family peptidase [Nocardia nova]|uniref:C40 family peptidase n=1 Tax=Nocardia nova TaxID=37330 RepID=UPI0007A40BC1|nr:NlpC/P60 family protein [Nocardia nova]MBV7707060.1 C40 family peptidase [Nocardia nova]
MSDPISVIATIVISATGAIDNANLPNAAKASAHAAVASGGDAAKSFSVQLDRAVSQLPEPAQQASRAAIDAASDHLAAMVPAANAPAEQSATDQAPEPDMSAPDRNGYEAAPLQADLTASPDPTNTEYAVAATRPVSIPVPDAAAVPPTATGRIAAFVPWFRKAGSLCSGIKAPTLAALYAAENGFRYGPDAPVSPTGALGPGQFMPGTWAVYGKDVHGTGTPDVFDIGDSVMASGHLLCDSYRQIEMWKGEGRVVGDTLALTIAAYNAGAGAVFRSGGMPSGSPDYEHQTKPYVARILATREQYEWLSADDYLLPAANHSIEDVGHRIVAQAVRYLGLPYVWGGGDSNGPTSGGFDCSGLTSFAVHAATGGAVTLPRTSQGQWHVGVEIPLSEAAPGDLLFGSWAPDDGQPGHVAIYLGNNRMIHAPQPGETVRISPVMSGMHARRIN